MATGWAWCSVLQRWFSGCSINKDGLQCWGLLGESCLQVCVSRISGYRMASDESTFTLLIFFFLLLCFIFLSTSISLSIVLFHLWALYGPHLLAKLLNICNSWIGMIINWIKYVSRRWCVGGGLLFGDGQKKRDFLVKAWIWIYTFLCAQVTGLLITNARWPFTIKVGEICLHISIADSRFVHAGEKMRPFRAPTVLPVRSFNYNSMIKPTTIPICNHLLIFSIKNCMINFWQFSCPTLYPALANAVFIQFH